MAPILHWMQPDIKLQPATEEDSTPKLVHNNDEAIAFWAPPRPPPGAAPHRYVFFLYEQPENFDAAKWKPANGKPLGLWKRIRFDLDGFEKGADLGKALAVGWFCSNWGKTLLLEGHCRTEGDAMIVIRFIWTIYYHLAYY